MIISKIEICVIELPMIQEFHTGFGKIHSKPEIIVKLITSDGLIGYGEGPTLDEPLFNHETLDSCIAVIKHSLAPRIQGKNFDTVYQFVAAYSDLVGNPAAKNAVECAFWHLVSQRDGVSLKQLFGGSQERIVVGEGVGIKQSIGEVLEEVAAIIEKGFARVKLKIQPGNDIKPLVAVRSHWPDICLTVDGNGAYNYQDHRELLLSLSEFNLDMLEQPLPVDDLVDHAALQLASATPICLDESIASLNDARSAIALQACKIINIKPGRVGGILEAIAIHDYAAANGVTVWAGGMLETGIGRAFNLALASRFNFTHAADMSPFNMYYSDDITNPALVLDPAGTIAVPDIPGLGYTVNEAKLSKYTSKLISI